MLTVSDWKNELTEILDEFQKQANLQKGQIFVIGCSTSEIVGERIGTAGTDEVAAMVYETLSQFSKQPGVHRAFQCCEHLNRALVVQRELADTRGFEQVTVVPVRQAGGAMASYAYRNMPNAVMVEHIKADGGIDIGYTFIGMHIKHVAVPVRVKRKNVGQAHITLATTRPKLIGGARAIYVLEDGT